jgi:biotin-(acetyl-CoA carboxylase) ligase
MKWPNDMVIALPRYAHAPDVTCVRNDHHVALAALTGYAREGRQWLVNAEEQDKLKGRMATRLWRAVRRTKRSLSAVTARLPMRRGVSS